MIRNASCGGTCTRARKPARRSLAPLHRGRGGPRGRPQPREQPDQDARRRQSERNDETFQPLIAAPTMAATTWSASTAAESTGTERVARATMTIGYVTETPTAATAHGEKATTSRPSSAPAACSSPRRARLAPWGRRRARRSQPHNRSPQAPARRTRRRDAPRPPSRTPPVSGTEVTSASDDAVIPTRAELIKYA